MEGKSMDANGGIYASLPYSIKVLVNLHILVKQRRGPNFKVPLILGEHTPDNENLSLLFNISKEKYFVKIVWGKFIGLPLYFYLIEIFRKIINCMGCVVEENMIFQVTYDILVARINKSHEMAMSLLVDKLKFWIVNKLKF